MNTIPMTVLITTANKPPEGVPHLRMGDPVMRTITAKAALYFWVAQGIEQIVLADATGTNLLSEEEEAELDKTETRIEQINYKQPSEDVVKRGKGYGEGKLIEYALENSELLAREQYFFKCTGKTYVRNFQTLAAMIQAERITNMFWRHLGDGSSLKPWADVRFYYTSKSFAKTHLLPAYSLTEDHKAACEYHICNALEGNLQPGRTHRPLVVGYSGATAEAYFDHSLGYLDFNSPCWVSHR